MTIAEHDTYLPVAVGSDVDGSAFGWSWNSRTGASAAPRATCGPGEVGLPVDGLETIGELKMAEKLEGGGTFPSVTLQLVGGDSRSLPEDLETDYGVVLFYRGHW